MNDHSFLSHSRRDVFFLFLAVALCTTAAYVRFIAQDTSRFSVDLLLFAPSMLLVAVSRFVRVARVRSVMMVGAFALIGVMLIVRVQA